MRTVELCKVCKREYIKKHSRHFYCSKECKLIANPPKKPVSVSCTNCGGEATFARCNYIRKQNSPTTLGFFCSKKCEAEFRSKQAEDVRICENCKKEFKCKKYDKLRFCSNACQGAWQSEFRSGKNHPSYRAEIPDSKRIKNCPVCGATMVLSTREFETRITCSRGCASYALVIKTTNTKPHLAVQKLLKELNIKFSNECRVGNYFADIRIRNSKLLIEVNGDWWHTSPRISPEKRRPSWEDGILKDSKKQKFLLSKNYKILYLWELDIYNSTDVCRKLILSFIENKGELKNYHSFNYTIKDNNLVLNKDILIPLFESISNK